MDLYFDFTNQSVNPSQSFKIFMVNDDAWIFYWCESTQNCFFDRECHFNQYLFVVNFR